MEWLAECNAEELTLTESRFLRSQTCLSVLIEQSFKRLFQSYSINFNNSYSRKGNLFYRPFKRLVIDSDEEFKRAVTYIHTNPVKHGLTSDFTTYKWSSWQTMVSDNPTQLLRDELIRRFGCKELMISSHFERSGGVHLSWQLAGVDGGVDNSSRFLSSCQLSWQLCSILQKLQ